MTKIIRVLESWLTALVPTKFATAKISISSALGMAPNLSRTDFLSKLTAHLKANPMSYATVVSSVGILANDLLSWAAGSDLGDKELELINKVLFSGKESRLPQSSYDGPDGNADTVNGVSVDEFTNSAIMIKNARDNIVEIGAILGISNRSVIELAMRLNAVEPQHATILD
jgi:hypothetical protein